jgi:hypothetical protein
VTKPLQSVRALLASDHTVVFDGSGSFVYNKTTGEVNNLVDDNINFMMKQWIIPPEQVEEALAYSQGFTRQAP